VSRRLPSLVNPSKLRYCLPPLPPPLSPPPGRWAPLGLAASRVIEPVGPTVAAVGAWLGVAYGPPGPVIAEDVLPGTTVVVVDGVDGWVVFALRPPVESELVAAKPAVAVPMARALAKLKICNFFMGNCSSLHTQSGAERLTHPKRCMASRDRESPSSSRPLVPHSHFRSGSIVGLKS